MKHLKRLNELFESIQNNELFKNEKQLKEELFKDQNFADGDVHQAIVNIAHEEWQKNQNMGYDKIIDYLDETYGDLAVFAMLLAKYNYQVGNGGHMQYYDNGYASSMSRGFGHTYDNIDLHDTFEELFKKLEMDTILENGKEALQIISSFELELGDETGECSECRGSGNVDCDNCNGDGNVECPSCHGSGEDDEGEECSECEGNGDIECDECDGSGEHVCEECDGKGEVVEAENVPWTGDWDKLDTKWYKIERKVMESFNNYLKTLTLNGEKIENLIPLAKSTQKYNI